MQKVTQTMRMKLWTVINKFLTFPLTAISLAAEPGSLFTSQKFLKL